MTRFPTRNTLPEEIRLVSIGLLNQALADLTDLHSQTKQAHWNVKGMQFIALHELFDDFAETLEEHIDTVAERVTALGGVANGTVRMAAAHTALPELPAVYEGRAVVEALAERYALAGTSVRSAIDAAGKAGDADTSDLFTGVSRDLDKQLWFLEAHLNA
ncbi:MAG: DNA starvation/stationary phase protection protein Dps [Anaerolineae bacterium]|jgi:starvation-inducible DNA-binding protein|nr:DNA starvation/stationary phase protection protein Dps [Anaerolineae bacterium]